MSGSFGRLEIDPSALEELTTAFGGEIVHPSDPSYQEHRRVWNGSIDRHPALIARCAGVADVIAAVKLGRRTAFRWPCAVGDTASLGSLYATTGSLSTFL